MIPNKYYRILLFIVLCSGCQAGEPSYGEVAPPPEFLEKTVIGFNSSMRQRFVNNHQLYAEGWDTLAQAKFWSEIINLSHDSMIMNIASCRQPLIRLTASEWHCQSPEEKDLYKQNICYLNRLSSVNDLYVTGGKKFFFEFRKVLPMVSQAIPVFEKYNTDPWYAQTILLIESPGKSDMYSSVGARGPFQLMPYVARKYGLVVTRSHDDRTNLEKSAGAAARFISGVCIPTAKKILDDNSITYHENDLWFRLFVMHIYHAGSGNVNAVINKIQPQSGGMSLIRQMWRTEAAGFKNESQNYSQIALAAIICFDRIINQPGDTLYLVEGDKRMKDFHRRGWICADTLAYLKDCLTAYGNDLVEGTIPFSHFVESTEKVNKEIRACLGHYEAAGSRMVAMNESERLFNLGNELMYKRKFNDAIQVFQTGLQHNPVSPATYDSLGRAYRMLGNSELAVKYTRISKEVISNPGAFSK